MGNALNTLSSATKEDTKLYNCIKELYEQGVPFDELKALIPDMKRTREQLRMKRMLENNNEVLTAMITKELSFLLDAKEAGRRTVQTAGSIDPPATVLSERSCQSRTGRTAETPTPARINWQTSCNPAAMPDERSLWGRFFVLR